LKDTLACATPEYRKDAAALTAGKHWLTPLWGVLKSKIKNFHNSSDHIYVQINRRNLLLFDCIETSPVVCIGVTSKKIWKWANVCYCEHECTGWNNCSLI